jgi:hypothetical protein
VVFERCRFLVDTSNMNDGALKASEEPMIGPCRVQSLESVLDVQHIDVVGINSGLKEHFNRCLSIVPIVYRACNSIDRVTDERTVSG